jgi:hypothetical protein
MSTAAWEIDACVEQAPVDTQGSQVAHRPHPPVAIKAGARRSRDPGAINELDGRPRRTEAGRGAHYHGGERPEAEVRRHQQGVLLYRAGRLVGHDGVIARIGTSRILWHILLPTHA